MAKRKPISDSLRWTVFARDGFRCRYCGRQAGQDGVVLAVDHVISVVYGGDNRIDNLLTACKTCNGGKSAKSLLAVPTTGDVVDRINEKRVELEQQAQTIRQAMEAEAEAEQAIVNMMKCDAYGVKSTQFNRGEATTARNLITEFGADVVLGWYKAAASRRVSEWKAILYVCGCAQKTREAGDAQ
jgi:hypothetical protein